MKQTFLSILIASAVAIGGSIHEAAALRAGAQPNARAEFDAFLTQVEAAQVDFAQARPGPFKALWSQHDDVTVSGGFGGQIEKGWANVSPRLDWASSQFSEGNRTREIISSVVGADLAYVVQIERIRFRVPGEGREASRDYRATMVFRRENGAWRIVHRHADSQNTRESSK
jgi:ketosteroid isomerase-like protein